MPNSGSLQSIAVSTIEASHVSGSVQLVSKSGAARVFTFHLTEELSWISSLIVNSNLADKSLKIPF